MSRSNLQGILDQLSNLTSTELSKVKEAVNERLERYLRTLGTHGGLTAEEWEILEGEKYGLISCVKMVRERTGLGLVDSKAYVDRARATGRPKEPTLDDNGAGPQRDSAGHTLYCPRGCCDTPAERNFGNGGRWEDPK
jgi:ribosomal protein L7/L12